MADGNAAPILDEAHLRRLIEVGRKLVSELDLERLLGEALEAARELTGARYAALGVLAEHRAELERFLTLGMDAATRRRIGDPPRGHGVLGLLIEDPGTVDAIRIDEISDHPRSTGFPPGHPEMHSFLGVPLIVRGISWGNLYLTDKTEGSFTPADEEAAKVLAHWISAAIENAQLYNGIERQRDELRRAVRGLQAASEIAAAVGGETDLQRILETIVERGRLLVDADWLAILLLDSDGTSLRLVAPLRGEVEMPLQGSEFEPACRSHEVAHLPRIPHDLRQAMDGDPDPEHIGRAITDAEEAHPEPATVVPIVFRGGCLGALVASEAGGVVERADYDEELVLRSIAASTATAVGTARSVAVERVRQGVEAAERERGRWAREIHDDTLQNLAGVRLTLARAQRLAQSSEVEKAVGEALGRTDEAIAEMRRLIADLRPAALDELGIGAALGSLVERIAAGRDLEVDLNVAIGVSAGGDRPRLPAEVEITIYRIAQEALNNVAAHSGARRAIVEVVSDAEEVVVEVSDDGVGFDPSASSGGEERGFGLRGMAERVALLGGTFAIDSSPGNVAPSRGATIRAEIPVEIPSIRPVPLLDQVEGGLDVAEVLGADPVAEHPVGPRLVGDDDRDQ